MLKNIPALVKICRPLNSLLVFFTVLVACLISSEDNAIISFDFFLAAFSASLISSAGYIINDLFDIKIDKINRPARPLVSDKLNKKTTLTFYLILNLLALIVSAYISILVFFIAFASVLSLYLYSFRLKKLLLTGNLLIALLTGLTFIYGGAVVNNISHAVIPSLFAFFINFIREIVKDMEDIKGDLSGGIETFPAKCGFSGTKKIITFCSILLILLTLYPFIFKLYKIEYFIIVMNIVNPVLVFFLLSLFKNDSKVNLNKLSFILKLNMFFGLTAIYFGK